MPRSRWIDSKIQQEVSSERIEAMRPTKLRSQRDINLWRIPLKLSLAAVALFTITLIPDVLDKYGIIHIPSWFTMGSIDDARAILGAMMGAVATVLALIFSVALLVLSMVSTLFGPRLLYRFLQDWVTQVTIGLFMGTFVYICLVFLVTHQDSQSTFIPQVSLITSWVLVVLSFGFLVYYSHRVAKSIQNPDMIGAIVDDLYVAAGSAIVSGPGEGFGPLPDDEAILRQAERGAIVPCLRSGYLQHVNHGALVAAAHRADALIVLKFRPGQFVLRGEALAAIVPADKAAAIQLAIDRRVHIGRHRTLTQDSEFGIAQVVEIAIRALSPAVNDTFTGVASVDWLAEALLTLAERHWKAIGTTLEASSGYGCRRCVWIVWLSWRSTRFGKPRRRHPRFSFANSRQFVGWQRGFQPLVAKCYHRRRTLFLKAEAGWSQSTEKISKPPTAGRAQLSMSFPTGKRRASKRASRAKRKGTTTLTNLPDRTNGD